MNAVALLLADGRFPGGGHAHSGGLEAAVAAGAVHDEASLAAFLACRLHTAGVVDAWAAAAVCAGADPAAVEAEYDARTPSPALRAVSRAQGRGLRRSAGRAWSELSSLEAETHPVVLGVTARRAGLSPIEAAAVVLHGIVMGGASAAVRLLPIDMADAAGMVARLAPVAEELAADVAAAAEADLSRGPAWSAPALELRAEDHARWEVRLFAS